MKLFFSSESNFYGCLYFVAVIFTMTANLYE